MTAAPYVTEEEFRRLCEFLYRRTGMIFGESKRYYVERRIADRMAATGAATFPVYFLLLRGDVNGEVEKFINAITVNETYFYREAHQFACMSRELLPALLRGREPGSRVRILCNPCATGEEPYSVALWLLENWPLVDAYNIEIVGADVDTAALGQAREGWYEPRSLSRLPPALVDAYFEPAAGDRRRIIRDLRESVSFTSANLIEAASMRGLGEFDLPLSVACAGTTDDVALSLRNRGPEKLTAVFAVRVRGGSLQYARLADLPGGTKAMKAVNGAAFDVVRLRVQKASFHDRMIASSMVEAMPGTAIGVST